MPAPGMTGIEFEYLLILPLAFAAYLLKSVATFGPGIVLVPLGALLIGVAEIVVVIAFLDFISNALLLGKSGGWQQRRVWGPMVVCTVFGSFVGAALFLWLPLPHYEPILGMALVCLGGWILLFGPATEGVSTEGKHTPQLSAGDRLAAGGSGAMGGLCGITGPVLAFYLAPRLPKEMFRAIMIPVLFASATSRVLAYSASGAVNGEILTLVAWALPGLFAGLMVGNALFDRISLAWFRRVIAVLVAISGIKLIAR